MLLKDIRQELTEHLGGEMERLRVPGVAIGIVHGDEDLIVTRGVTSVDNPLEVDETTLFQIGSRTKTFTTTALMRQVEAGKLDLDAPLTTYLPNFTLSNPEYGQRVTPRHLLTHTGGWIGDYFLMSPIKGRGEDALARLADAIEEPPCLTPPGEVVSYNNAAFCLAGRLLEVLTGETFEDAIRKLVLDPLELNHTFFFADEVITERTVSGHIVRDGVPTVARPWGISRSSHPTGGIISDTPDQLRYARFHLGDGATPRGERILSADTLATMQTEQVPGGGLSDAVGLPWLLVDVGGTRTVTHSGGMNGQISAFMLIPQQRFAVTVMTNSDAGRVLSGAMAKWILEKVLGIKDVPPTPIDRPAEELDEYTGAYAFGIIQVERDGSHLLVTRQAIPGSELMEETSPPARIAFYDKDRVVCVGDTNEAGAKGDFLRDDDGNITFLRWGGRILPRYPAD
jgi:CubicO group peptidase (beta-lactamase class C family)